MNIQLGLANDDQARQCFKFLKLLYQDNYYGVSKEFLNWKYSVPFFDLFCQEGEHPIMVASLNGEVQAFEVFLPMATMIGGAIVPTVWTTDWINNSRKSGLGRQVFSALRQRAELKCFYGANNFSKSACEKSGLRVENHIQRMVSILNPKKCIELFFVHSRDKIDFYRENIFPHREISCCNSLSCEGFSSKYWEDFQSRFYAVSYRGLDYLKWRYMNFPGLNYHFITLDKKAEHGLSVVRIEKVKGSNECLLRILDMLPARGYEVDLVQAVMCFARAHDVFLADFFCASTPYAKELFSEKFLSLNEHILYDIPMLFQPIETRERKSINMVLDNFKRPDVVFDSFYTSKADAEQDILLNPGYSTPIV